MDAEAWRQRPPDHPAVLRVVCVCVCAPGGGGCPLGKCLLPRMGGDAPAPDVGVPAVGHSKRTAAGARLAPWWVVLSSSPLPAMAQPTSSRLPSGCGRDRWETLGCDGPDPCRWGVRSLAHLACALRCGWTGSFWGGCRWSPIVTCWSPPPAPRRPCRSFRSMGLAGTRSETGQRASHPSTGCRRIHKRRAASAPGCSGEIGSCDCMGCGLAHSRRRLRDGRYACMGYFVRRRLAGLCLIRGCGRSVAVARPVRGRWRTQVALRGCPAVFCVGGWR